mgnify:CR=1 FL=1
MQKSANSVVKFLHGAGNGVTDKSFSVGLIFLKETIMYDDPQPDDVVEGLNGRTCTVREFNAMSQEEKKIFVYGTALLADSSSKTTRVYRLANKNHECEGCTAVYETARRRFDSSMV